MMMIKTVTAFILLILNWSLLTASEGRDFWNDKQKQAHALYFEDKNYQAVLDITDFPGLYEPIDNLPAENGYYSDEQFSYLRLWWFRAYSAYYSSKYVLAIKSFEAYLNQTKYTVTARTRFDYTTLAECYIKTGNLQMAYATLDKAIGNHTLLESESEALSNSFLYYERENYIDEYGQKEDYLHWAREIYRNHHREAHVFAKASEAAFELKKDEAGVLWYLRYATSQYDRFGQLQNTFPPILSQWKRELKGENTAEMDFCTVLYNSYLGLPVINTAQENRARKSKWGHLLPADKKVSLRDLLEIRQTVEGKADKKYLSTLLDVSNHYLQFKDYENALSIAELIREEAQHLFSKESHTNFSLSLYCAKIRYFTGDLSGSLTYFRELESEGEPYEKEYKSILNFESSILSALGRQEEALILLEKEEELTGPYSEEMIVLHERKAALYAKLGSREEAEHLYNSAVSRRELGLPGKIKTGKISDYLEEKIWDCILSLNKRASFHYKNGSYEKAEKDYEKISELFPHLDMKADNNKKFSRALSRFPKMFEILLHMADLLMATDDMKTADQVIESLKENMKTMEKMAGQSDFILPGQLLSQFNLTLAKYREKAGEPEEAVNHLLDAEKYYRDLVKNQWDYLNEREKGQILSRIKPVYRRFHEMAVLYGNQSEYIAETAYEKALQSKAVLLKASRNLRSELVSGSADAETALKYQKWLENRRLLARYYCGIYTVKNQSVLKDLEKTVSDLERELYTITGKKISAEQNETQTETEDILVKLQEEEAVVEMVLLEDETYLAYVLKGNNSTVTVVDMGLAEEVDLAYEQWQRFIRQSRKRTILDRMLPSAEYIKTHKQLYNRLWQPLEKTLQGVKKIYCSGDGIYLTFNPATLQPGNDRYIEDRYDFVFLTSSADLAEASFKPEHSARNKDIVLLGDPLFRFENRVAAKSDAVKTRAFDYYNRMDFHPENVASLPGTREEIESIRTILTEKGITPDVLLNRDATEGSVKSVQSPGVLHLATHGFFHEEKEGEKKNPLLSSGLLLAGCEDGVNAEKNQGEDGILTAYEALNMNLSGTKIVILSACETALGKRVNGEGVFGLQRAFSIAGTDYILMSLWSVDDFATSLFMTSFYDIWLKGESIPGACAQAVEEVRSRYPEPYYWGAFILMGME